MGSIYQNFRLSRWPTSKGSSCAHKIWDGQYQQQRVLAHLRQCRMRSQGDGRCRIAAFRFQQDGGGRQSQLQQLLCHDETVSLVTNNNGPGDVREARQAGGGLLQHGALAREGQKLLGHQLAGQRPQAGAGAARKDDGDEGHGGGIVPY